MGACMWNEKFFEDILNSNRLNKYVLDITESTAISAVQASYNVQAAAIITLTTSGDTAIKCAKYRPQCPVVAVSRDNQVARQLQLHRGVSPYCTKRIVKLIGLKMWTHAFNLLLISAKNPDLFKLDKLLFVSLDGVKDP